MSIQYFNNYKGSQNPTIDSNKLQVPYGSKSLEFFNIAGNSNPVYGLGGVQNQGQSGGGAGGGVGSALANAFASTNPVTAGVSAVANIGFGLWNAYQGERQRRATNRWRERNYQFQKKQYERQVKREDKFDRINLDNNVINKRNNFIDNTIKNSQYFSKR